MTKKLILIFSLLTIIQARENINLTEIYTEFTETVTVQYRRTIKIKQRQVDINKGNPISDIVYLWNNAVNSRDTNKLFSLYAPKVLYYGTKFKDKSCVKDKKRFYRKYPFFTQSIDNINIVNVSENLYKVYFDKYVRLKENSRLKNYPSYLLIGYFYGRLYIYVEGDIVTDRNLLKRYKRVFK